MARDYVEIIVDIIKETDDALLVKYEGEEIWLPKSQVHEADTLGEGDDDVEIEITQWIADQKGIT